MSKLQNRHYLVCDDCGDRHHPESRTECVENLLSRIAELEAKAAENAALTERCEEARIYIQSVLEYPAGFWPDEVESIRKWLAGKP